MGVPERLQMSGDVPWDVSECRVGANEWRQVKTQEGHRIAMKNLK